MANLHKQDLSAPISILGSPPLFWSCFVGKTIHISANLPVPGNTTFALCIKLGVSKNGGTPKWMVKIMENPIKIHDLGGKNHYFWVDAHIICTKLRAEYLGSRKIRCLLSAVMLPPFHPRLWLTTRCVAHLKVFTECHTNGTHTKAGDKTPWAR